MKSTIKLMCCYKNIPVAKLAEKLNKSAPNFYQMMNRNDFRESELKKIAAALDCELIIKFKDNLTGKEF